MKISTMMPKDFSSHASAGETRDAVYPRCAHTSLKLLLTLLLYYNTAASAAEQTATAPTGNLFQMLLGLTTILGLLAAVAWSLKRFGPGKASAAAHIKVVSGISVGNRERILVIEVADQWIVVGVTQGQINTLSTMPRQQQNTESLPTTVPSNNFAAWLKQTLEKRNGNG